MPPESVCRSLQNYISLKILINPNWFKILKVYNTKTEVVAQPIRSAAENQKSQSALD